MLTEHDASLLLDLLCSELGFCLRPNDRAKLRQRPPADPESFAAEVFRAEGVDPALTERHIVRAVRARIRAAFAAAGERTGIDWNRARAMFEADGALRDIVVRETTREDWVAFLACVADAGWPTGWLVDGVESQSLTVERAFELGGRVLLRIELGELPLHCHFFDEGEIECDLDPRDVACEATFASIQQFMARVGDQLDKPVHLTDEGQRCRTGTRMAYSPVRRSFD